MAGNNGAVAGREVTAVAINDLQHLLAVQGELRAGAERKWQHAQRALVGLLEAFAAEEVERRLRAGEALDSLPVESLAGLVAEQVKLRLQKAQEKERQENRSARDAEELAKRYRSICKALEAEKENNQRLQATVERLDEANRQLNNELSALRQVQQAQRAAGALPQPAAAGSPPALPSGVEPDWMSAWRQASTFERDSSVLRLIGETGLARRPLIAEKAAGLLGLQKPGGSVNAVFQRLVEADLLEKYQPWKDDGAGSGGRHPDLLRLTEQGRLAYWLLTQKQPAPNEMDTLLARHVTPEHTLLNLQAADFLQAAGYRVEMEPPDITLPDGGLFKPDLLLHDGEGKTLFVEVEIDSHKNREQRKAKWHNFYQAGGGCLYVVCDNRSCMKSIVSEINLALGTRPAVTHLTNLADLQAGKRGEQGSIWLQVRKRA
ncbi:MAG: hypothetical protein ACOYYS_17685 [Chloroflexota bacterium]